MTALPAARIAEALGREPVSSVALPGGSIGPVWRVRLSDGADVVVKYGAAHGRLDLEGWMLGVLAQTGALPVPRVHHAEPDLLILEHVAGAGAVSPAVEGHAAECLARLHGVTGAAFGLDRDTPIGALMQPNAQSAHWVSFFRDRRLMHMGQLAQAAGGLPEGCLARLIRLCDRLEDVLPEPDAPRLIHGDVWGGNIIVGEGVVAAFIDPALHFADPELELAYTTMFHTFGTAFFARYGEIRPIDPEFWASRREVYMLYPLLVHAALFGPGYGASVDWILRRRVG